MISLKPKRLVPYLAGDMFTLILAFLISLYFFRDFKFSKFEWIVLSGLIFLWFFIEYWRKQYYSNFDHVFQQRISNHVKAYFGFIVLTILFYLLFPIPIQHRGRVISVLVGISVLDITINFLLVEAISKWKNTKENFKYVLVAGIGNMAKHVEEKLYLPHKSNYQLKGFINCNLSEECMVDNGKVLGDLESIHQYLDKNSVDEIVIALPNKFTNEIKNVLSVADYHGIRVKYILDYHEIFGDHYTITRLGQIDALNIRQLPIDGRYAGFMKYAFDKAFSAVALLLLSPLFLILALFIKLDSPGPVFYCPIRIGRAGKAFKVFKFRSMRVNDAASDGVLSTEKDDPRITRLGKMLRKYNLDELPQFINVFLGEMSVVGPRPHRRFLDRQLQESVYKYMIRHYVKPGITGWAQVNGWRGPTDTEEQKRQRTLHDLWYIENWSLWLDVKIIYLTIFSKKAHQNAF